MSNGVKTSVITAKTGLGKIDWETERKKTREAMQKVIEKYNLRGIKIRELSKREKDKLAMSLFE